MKKILFICFILFSIQFNAQLTNGLIVSYGFNGDAVDNTLNQLNGTLGGVISTTNRNNELNSALYFDGIDDNVVLPNSNLLKPQLPISIAFWINIEESEAATIFCSDYMDFQYYGFWVGITSGNEIHVNFGDGGTVGGSSRRSKIADEPLTIGEWHHIVCIIRSSDDMDIFVDCQDAGGFYDGSGSTSILYSSTSSPRIFNSVANSSFSPVFLKGKMDDLRVWNRELSANEITRFCSGIILNQESLPNVESICESVTLTPPTANDLSGNEIVGVSNTSFPINNAGSTIVTWTYTNLEGDITTQNQQVNIIDDLNVEIIQNQNLLSSNIVADSYKWIDCSNETEIPNEISHDFSPPTSGEYKLVVSSGICSDTSQCFTYNMLKLIDNTLIFEVYPNPVKDYLIVKNIKSENLTFVIYDELGKSIKNEKLINNKIDFRNLSNGIYILKIFDKENEISKLKVIKN